MLVGEPLRAPVIGRFRVLRQLSFPAVVNQSKPFRLARLHRSPAQEPISVPSRRTKSTCSTQLPTSLVQQSMPMPTPMPSHLDVHALPSPLDPSPTHFSQNPHTCPRTHPHAHALPKNKRSHLRRTTPRGFPRRDILLLLFAVMYVPCESAFGPTVAQLSPPGSCVSLRPLMHAPSRLGAGPEGEGEETR